ncbi:MAG: hypothetical protein MZV64_41275 [Ignavibacteriales bacterium]|nr:hypothetical protein [Ignavibacteriales bacterium]
MAIVPVTLNYLGKTEYGIWLTLASILSWLINLDFGLGNGLRNKLAEALALNDIKLARIYVSTAYAVFSVGIISCIYNLPYQSTVSLIGLIFCRHQPNIQLC